MTAEDLVTKLIADVRRIESETPRHSVHRAMVVHCINETVRLVERRASQPPQPQGAGEEGE